MQLLVEEPQSGEVEASQVRVTPQELVQATAVLEARHHARAQHEAATIPIGEAVHQLNLEVTPEEVLAEVQAQRNAKTQTQRTGIKRSQHPKATAILTAIVVVQLVVMALLGGRLAAANQKNLRWRQNASRDYARIQALEQTIQQQSAATTSAPQQTDVQLLNSDKFRNLNIGVGDTIRCKFDTIQTLATNNDFAHLYTAKKPVGPTWELVREPDGFFVKCWTTTNDAEQLVNGHSGLVYATKAGAFGEHQDTFVKLPVRAFQNAFVHATTFDHTPVGVVLKAAR